ncbi:MAG TPA: folate-binding protein [Alphaproteobacteria bacterium]|nr:folate-binding protein [Alphaproteobacteria bacterium]
MMTATTFCALPNRGVLKLTGPDARDFLQGIISNNIDHLAADAALYAALLTPQGKFLFDFFLVETSDGLLLDGERDRLAELEKRLKFYKLRADVTITDHSEEFSVYALFGDQAATIACLTDKPAAAMSDETGVRYVDPRLSAMGVRLILSHDELAELQGKCPELPQLAPADAGVKAYEAWRIGNGIADGSRDIAVEKYFLLEANFDALSGVDFKKGCYVGQELVSRMKHRNAVRKRIVPVCTEAGPLPAPQTAITTREGREAGTLLSQAGNRGLAYLRLEMLGEPLCAGDKALVVDIPAWLRTFIADDNAGQSK